MKIDSHRELDVYKNAMNAAVFVFALLKKLPADERYASAQQARRSAPSVCANLAEAWPKRRYVAHFMSKTTDAAAEAAETQVWLELWWRAGYISESEFNTGFEVYVVILKQIAALELSVRKANRTNDDHRAKPQRTNRPLDARR